MEINLMLDDIQFLRDLGRELKTQDHRCTAEPLIFQIQETKRECGFDIDYCDDICLVIGDDHDVYYSAEEYRRHLIDDAGYEESKVEHLTDFDAVEDFCQTEDIPCFKTGYRNIKKYSGAFLTAKACDRHIELNHYHYSEPHSYAEHGWRNPEFERLLGIVKKFAEVPDGK